MSAEEFGKQKTNCKSKWIAVVTTDLEDQSLEPCLPSQGKGMPLLVFEYLYRDASNHKAFGDIWLTGSLLDQERAALVGNLESGEFFVAEQIGVPPLYEELFKESGGRTQDDHAWHTFAGLRDETGLPSEVSVWGKATDLLAVIGTVKREWKPQLSPNFDW